MSVAAPPSGSDLHPLESAAFLWRTQAAVVAGGLARGRTLSAPCSACRRRAATRRMTSWPRSPIGSRTASPPIRTSPRATRTMILQRALKPNGRGAPIPRRRATRVRTTEARRPATPAWRRQNERDRRLHRQRAVCSAIRVRAQPWTLKDGILDPRGSPASGACPAVRQRHHGLERTRELLGWRGPDCRHASSTDPSSARIGGSGVLRATCVNAGRRPGRARFGGNRTRVPIGLAACGARRGGGCDVGAS